MKNNIKKFSFEFIFCLFVIYLISGYLSLGLAEESMTKVALRVRLIFETLSFIIMFPFFVFVINNIPFKKTFPLLIFGLISFFVPAFIDGYCFSNFEYQPFNTKIEAVINENINIKKFSERSLCLEKRGGQRIIIYPKNSNNSNLQANTVKVDGYYTITPWKLVSNKNTPKERFFKITDEQNNKALISENIWWRRSFTGQEIREGIYGGTSEIIYPRYFINNQDIGYLKDLK